MKVFISWHGDLSKRLAEELSKWLPRTLQYVKPYFSPDDIEKGARWDNEISEGLKASKVCVISLTRQCLDSKWIMFEAGAISTSHDRARVCAILFDIKPIDVEGPLQRFQATEFSKDDIRRLLETINLNADDDRKLTQDLLDDAFKTRWPELEDAVTKILKVAPPALLPERNDRSLLEEIVGAVRSMQTEQGKIRDSVDDIARLFIAPSGVPASEQRLSGVRIVHSAQPGATSLGKGSSATKLSATEGSG
jgi:TIR domain